MKPSHRAILQGGLVVAVLDIAYAITYWWLEAEVAPIRIFQSVAAGLLGRAEAREGGLATAALGGALHLFIATSMVGFYYLLSGKVRALVERPLPFGFLYGVGAFFFMNLVVLPLSASPPGKIDWSSSGVLISIVAHGVLVGIPCAVFSRRGRLR